MCQNNIRKLHQKGHSFNNMNRTGVTVVAGSNLKTGAILGPLRNYEFPAAWLDDDESDHRAQIIQIFDQNGRLVSDHSEHLWIHYLRSSRDVYEQNIEAVRSRDTDVYLRVIRPVESGELLCGWYEESYARLLNVPYLTPRNILGIQDYRCHFCDRKFNYPNQLKAHIMYICSNRVQNASETALDVITTDYNKETDSMRSFFDKRSREKSQHHSVSKTIPILESTIGSPSKIGTPPETRCQFLTSINYQVSCDLSRYSPPQPCTLEARFSLVQNGCVNRGNRGFEHPEIKDFAGIVRPYNQLKRIVKNSDEIDEEPLEILHKSFIEFSTKQGHLCVYCGKFYSRKYGLKIHLRTHTGYKPLKCKVCLRAFGDPSNLNKHIRLHAEGSTPYRCRLCGKILVRRRDLVRHLKSRHPGEKT